MCDIWFGVEHTWHKYVTVALEIGDLAGGKSAHVGHILGASPLKQLNFSELTAWLLGVFGELLAYRIVSQERDLFFDRI